MFHISHGNAYNFYITCCFIADDKHKKKYTSIQLTSTMSALSVCSIPIYGMENLNKQFSNYAVKIVYYCYHSRFKMVTDNSSRFIFLWNFYV